MKKTILFLTIGLSSTINAATMNELKEQSLLSSAQKKRIDTLDYLEKQYNHAQRFGKFDRSPTLEPSDSAQQAIGQAKTDYKTALKDYFSSQQA